MFPARAAPTTSPSRVPAPSPVPERRDAFEDDHARRRVRPVDLDAEPAVAARVEIAQRGRGEPNKDQRARARGIFTVAVAPDTSRYVAELGGLPRLAYGANRDGRLASRRRRAK